MDFCWNKTDINRRGNMTLDDWTWSGWSHWILNPPFICRVCTRSSFCLQAQFHINTTIVKASFAFFIWYVLTLIEKQKRQRRARQLQFGPDSDHAHSWSVYFHFGFDNKRRQQSKSQTAAMRFTWLWRDFHCQSPFWWLTPKSTQACHSRTTKLCQSCQSLPLRSC